MAVSFRAATGGQSSTAALAASVTQPAGAAAGDLVFVCVNTKDSQTFSAQSGWTLEQNANGASFPFTSAVWYRVLDGTESWPISFAWTGSSVKYAWNCAAFTPGAGNGMAIDGEAAVVVDTTGSTTHTANSKAAVAADVCSVIFNCGRRTASSATGITVTPPTNWTEPTNGDQTTASGTTNLEQLGVETCYRTGQSGTVTPTAATWSQTVAANVYHFLITDPAPETAPALEMSSFGTFSGVGSGATINHLVVAVTHSQAAGVPAPTVQLWDGATAQIGTTRTCTTGTSLHTDSFTFTGVTYSQLATLRVRYYATAVSGLAAHVDAVGLTVNYTSSAPYVPRQRYATQSITRAATR